MLISHDDDGGIFCFLLDINIYGVTRDMMNAMDLLLKAYVFERVFVYACVGPLTEC